MGVEISAKVLCEGSDPKSPKMVPAVGPKSPMPPRTLPAYWTPPGELGSGCTHPHLCLCRDFLFLLLKKQQHLGVTWIKRTKWGLIWGGGNWRKVTLGEVTGDEVQGEWAVTEPYLVSSATSTSAGAAIGALEWPAVGSSAFSSPLVEFSAWKGSGYQASTPAHPASLASIPSRTSPRPALTWFLLWGWALSR